MTDRLEAFIDKTNLELEAAYFKINRRAHDKKRKNDSLVEMIQLYDPLEVNSNRNSLINQAEEAYNDYMDAKLGAEYILELLNGRNDEFKECSKDTEEINMISEIRFDSVLLDKIEAGTKIRTIRNRPYAIGAHHAVRLDDKLCSGFIGISVISVEKVKFEYGECDFIKCLGDGNFQPKRITQYDFKSLGFETITQYMDYYQNRYEDGKYCYLVEFEMLK